MARLSALFAAVLSLAVAPVQAVSFSSASLSDFTITLFDLNPADGITSGITFLDTLAYASGFAQGSSAKHLQLGDRYRAVRPDRGYPAQFSPRHGHRNDPD